MLSKVVFVIFIVIIIEINCCAHPARPCRSANGTKNGVCIQSKNCADIRLNGVNLNPKQLAFRKKSICGMDLHNSELLFCCDMTSVIEIDKSVGNQECSSGATGSECEPAGFRPVYNSPPIVLPTEATTTTSSTTSTTSEIIVPARPCRFANGTIGTCIQSKHCADIELNGANLSPEQFAFINKSLCGIALDNSKLFCCDKASVNGIDKRVGNQEYSSLSTLSESEQAGPVYTSPPLFSPTEATTTTSSTTSQIIVPTRPCRSAIGTIGTCVQSKHCADMKLNGTNLSPEQLAFKSKSLCGIDMDDSELFCCDNTSVIGIEKIVANQEYSSLSTSSESEQAGLVYTSTPLFLPPEATTTTSSTTSQIIVPVRPCRSPNGANGACIKLKHCADMHIGFKNKSLCGIDTDNSELFCCDKTSIIGINIRVDNQEYTSGSAATVSESEQAIVRPVYPSPPIFLPTEATTTTSSTPSNIIVPVRPCRLANGGIGACIKLKHCADMKMNGANLSPEQLAFKNNSLCGTDVDNSELFCCNKTAVIGITIRIDNQEFTSGATVSESEQATVGPAYPSLPIFLPTEATTITSSTTSKIIEPQSCRTPNGEKAKCIPIRACQKLLDLVSGKPTENQRKFLKESRCNNNVNSNPLVCCGSDEDFKDRKSRTDFKLNPLIPVKSCGIQNVSIPNRIFGGSNSNMGEFPWLALLSFETRNGKHEFACGGSLISSRYVLTAAHCLTADGYNLTSVRLGEWDFAQKQNCSTSSGNTKCYEPAVDIAPKSIHVHPSYQVGSRDDKNHDIALIKLETDVNFTNYIQPICLPNIDEFITPGEMLTISGWGLISYDEETTVKHKVQVPAISISQCSIMFEKSSKLKPIGSGQICAGGESGKDACVGDSGNPLMKNYNSTLTDAGPWYLEGIVSFGSACGLTDRYGVYTKVSEYLEWINSTITP